jgi:hypothetical protein
MTRLPDDSLFAIATRGQPWDQMSEIHAALVEISHATWHASASLASAMTEGKYRGPKKPLRIPRPGDPKPEPMTLQKVRSMLIGGGR